MFKPWVAELRNSMFEPWVEPGLQVFEPRVRPGVRVLWSPHLPPHHRPKCSNLGFGNTANTYAHVSLKSLLLDLDLLPGDCPPQLNLAYAFGPGLSNPKGLLRVFACYMAFKFESVSPKAPFVQSRAWRKMHQIATGLHYVAGWCFQSISGVCRKSFRLIIRELVAYDVL